MAIGRLGDSQPTFSGTNVAATSVAGVDIDFRRNEAESGGGGECGEEDGGEVHVCR